MTRGPLRLVSAWRAWRGWGNGVFSVRGWGAARQGASQAVVTVPEAPPQPARGGPGEAGPGGPAGGGPGRGPGGPDRARLLVAGGLAIVVIIAGASYVLFRSSGGASSGQPQAPVPPVSALHVLSVSPAAGATGVDGAAPVVVSFNGPLRAGSASPVITPAVPGTWRHLGDDAVFTPATALAPGRHYTVEIPAGAGGVRAVGGAGLGRPTAAGFTTGAYSQLRLAQIMAQLGYLPLTWSPATGPQGRTATMDQAYVSPSQAALAFSPAPGTFTWESGYPAELTSQWTAGQPNVLLRGAVMAFQHEHGMAPTGTMTAGLWADLFTAAAVNDRSTVGYTYALASQVDPETLTIWHDGRQVFRSLANTGIPAAPTANGTFPVYDKLPFQIMQGTNPGGSHYSDPVWYVSYFNGGDAVHYFPRPGYGYQQSLGCVELPWSSAAAAYPYLTYGSLVTVAG
jgi:hypothetical protein